MFPLEIILVPAEELHDYWPWLEAGIHDILKRSANPNKYWPEDVYAALRYKTAEAFIYQRNARRLFFTVGYTQKAPYTNLLEYFIWAGWAIPLKERQEEDCVLQTKKEVFEFIHKRAKELHCMSIVMRTTRKGWEKHGFILDSLDYRMPVK